MRPSAKLFAKFNCIETTCSEIHIRAGIMKWWIPAIAVFSNWFHAVGLRRLYWADWNRDGPKIEMSNMDGTERIVLVKDNLALPNGLTFDYENQQLCWADAGRKCTEPSELLLVMCSLVHWSILMCRDAEAGVYGSSSPAEAEYRWRNPVSICPGFLWKKPLLHWLEEVPPHTHTWDIYLVKDLLIQIQKEMSQNYQHF